MLPDLQSHEELDTSTVKDLFSLPLQPKIWWTCPTSRRTKMALALSVLPPRARITVGLGDLPVARVNADDVIEATLEASRAREEAALGGTCADKGRGWAVPVGFPADDLLMRQLQRSTGRAAAAASRPRPRTAGSGAAAARAARRHQQQQGPAATAAALREPAMLPAHGAPHLSVFPFKGAGSLRPATRVEAVLLRQWMQRELASLRDVVVGGAATPAFSDDSGSDDDDGSDDEHDEAFLDRRRKAWARHDAAGAREMARFAKQKRVLDAAAHELARQACVGCVERGELTVP